MQADRGECSAEQIQDHAQQPQHHGQHTPGGGEGVEQGARPFLQREAVEAGGGDISGVVQKIGASSVVEDAGDLSAEEGGGQEEEGDEQDDQKSHAARALAVARQTRLHEYAEEVIAEMNHHGGDD